jgi:hypothetical protein
MSAGFFASRLHETPLLSQVHLRVVRMIASSAMKPPSEQKPKASYRTGVSSYEHGEDKR